MSKFMLGFFAGVNFIGLLDSAVKGDYPMVALHATIVALLIIYGA